MWGTWEGKTGIRYSLETNGMNSVDVTESPRARNIWKGEGSDYGEKVGLKCWRRGLWKERGGGGLVRAR